MGISATITQRQQAPKRPNTEITLPPSKRVAPSVKGSSVYDSLDNDDSDDDSCMSFKRNGKQMRKLQKAISEVMKSKSSWNEITQGDLSLSDED